MADLLPMHLVQELNAGTVTHVEMNHTYQSWFINLPFQDLLFSKFARKNAEKARLTYTKMTNAFASPAQDFCYHRFTF